MFEVSLTKVEMGRYLSQCNSSLNFLYSECTRKGRVGNWDLPLIYYSPTNQHWLYLVLLRKNTHLMFLSTVIVCENIRAVIWS